MMLAKDASTNNSNSSQPQRRRVVACNLSMNSRDISTRRVKLRHK